MENYQLSKPLYIAGKLESDPSSCTMIVNGQIKLTHDFMESHEEAYDRTMYSINQVFQRKNSETITVVTSDTDIITVLLYHLNNAWVGKSVHVLKKGRIVSSKQQYCTEFSCSLVEGLSTVFPQPKA